MLRDNKNVAISVVAALVLACRAMGAQPIVQVCIGDSASANETSHTATCPTPTTPGNMLVAFVTEGQNNTSTATISDSSGQGGWLQTTSGYTSQNSAHRAGMFYWPNSASASSVTVLWAGGLATRVGILVVEVNGAALSNVEDVSANASNPSGTMATSTNIVSSTNDIVLFGVHFSSDYMNPVAGLGYAIPVNGFGTRGAVEYKTVPPGNVTALMNWSGAATSANILAAFRLGGPPPPPPSPPSAPSNPVPTSGSTGVAINATFSWAASSGATSYDVYFGTPSAPPFVGNQTGTTYSPGMLAYSTTYNWLVVAKNAGGSTSSPTWSFTTASAPPPPPPPPSTGLVIKGVQLPLVFDSATGILSCPTCVVADFAGNVTIGGALMTGTATGAPGQITIPSMKSTSGTRHVCVDTSGNLVSSVTPCSGT